jgi:hypothetical protein
MPYFQYSPLKEYRVSQPGTLFRVSQPGTLFRVSQPGTLFLGVPVRYSFSGVPVRYSFSGVPVRYSLPGVPVRCSFPGVPARYSFSSVPARYAFSGVPVRYSLESENWTCKIFLQQLTNEHNSQLRFDIKYNYPLWIKNYREASNIQSRFVLKYQDFCFIWQPFLLERRWWWLWGE